VEETPIHREKNPLAFMAGAGGGGTDSAVLLMDDSEANEIRDCAEGLRCSDAGNEGDIGSRFGDRYPLSLEVSKSVLEGRPLGKTVLKSLRSSYQAIFFAIMRKRNRLCKL